MEHSEEKHTVIQDLGSFRHEEEPSGGWLGIYDLSSFFAKEKSHITAQGLLEIAAYVGQNRAKLEQEAARSIISLPEDRYYVEQMSATEYQVRERLEAGQNSPNDLVVRLFENQPFGNDRRYQAYAFAGHVNASQRHLDELYGHWTRHAAVTKSIKHGQQYSGQVRPLPNLTPFRFRWYFPSLGAYRPCEKTYCGIPYENLPPLPENLFLGTMDWLNPLETDIVLRGMDHYYSEMDLQRLISAAQRLKITLPDTFLRCMRSPELLERIPSCTDCYFDLSAQMIAYPGDEEGYLLRFLIDRQGVIAWYLYLTPQGKHYVLAGPPWLDDPGTPESTEPMPTGKVEEEQRRATTGPALDVCALSFEAFLYRFWIENMIWYKIIFYKNEKSLNEEEEHYLQYYHSA